jgi:hypothetical protein
VKAQQTLPAPKQALGRVGSAWTSDDETDFAITLQPLSGIFIDTPSVISITFMRTFRLTWAQINSEFRHRGIFLKDEKKGVNMRSIEKNKHVKFAPLTRRIAREDGFFGGVIVMTTDPGLFTSDAFRPDRVGSHASSAIIGLDGLVRLHK